MLFLHVLHWNVAMVSILFSSAHRQLFLPVFTCQPTGRRNLKRYEGDGVCVCVCVCVCGKGLASGLLGEIRAQY